MKARRRVAPSGPPPSPDGDAARHITPPGTLAEARTVYRQAREVLAERPDDPAAWTRLAHAQDGYAALYLPLLGGSYVRT